MDAIQIYSYFGHVPILKSLKNIRTNVPLLGKVNSKWTFPNTGRDTKILYLLYYLFLFGMLRIFAPRAQEFTLFRRGILCQHNIYS